MMQRRPPVESQALRNSAQGKNCTLRLDGCSHDSDTVVLCHIYVGPKATGGKGHDLHAVYGCANCHGVIDRRWRFGQDPPYFDILRALIETQSIFIAEGLISVVGDKQVTGRRPKSVETRERVSKQVPRPTEWRP